MSYLEKMMQVTGYQPVSDIKEMEYIFREYDNGNKNVEELVETLKSCLYIYDNYELMTEFIMYTNWKSWEHYEKGNEKLSRAYASAYYELQDAFYEHYENNKEAISYFFTTTD